MSLLSFVHMHACCQCPVVQNLLAVLIGKCWAGTGEHIPYIIGTGFWKFPKCVFCNNRVFSPMREECVSSWVSDSFVHRSSLSHCQLGWKPLTGWLHTVSLYPLTGQFRYRCKSGASRRKPDVNSRWRVTLSDVGRAAALICAKAVESCSIVIWTRGELSQLPGWSCQ
jgi:hypothetical protein